MTKDEWRKKLREIITYQIESHGGKINPKDDFYGFLFDVEVAISALQQDVNEELRECVKELLDGGPDCDCPPEGHICGWPTVKQKAQAALASAEHSYLNSGKYFIDASDLDDLARAIAQAIEKGELT